jgi:hypothetical protein
MKLRFSALIVTAILCVGSLAQAAESDDAKQIPAPPL